MTKPKNPDQAQTPPVGASGEAAKKPYVKPSYRHERVFETMALACGKISGTQAQCVRVKKLS